MRRYVHLLRELVAEYCLFMLGTINHFQMVDRLDGGFISADLGTLDYKGLYKVICFTGPKFH